MNLFSNSFFSVAGQKERFQNVANVLSISVNPLSQNKITANINNPTLKAATIFVANNPYSTAAIIATGGSSAARTGITNAISQSSTFVKIAGGATTLAAVPFLAISEKARVATLKAAATITPERIVKFGGQGGQLLENPSLKGTGDFAKNNSGILAAAGVAAVAAGGIGLLNLVNTAQNTAAVKANTQSAENNIINIPKQEAPQVNVNFPSPVAGPATAAATTTSPAAVAAPISPVNSTTKKKKSTTKKKKAKKKPKKKAKKKAKKKPVKKRKLNKKAKPKRRK